MELKKALAKAGQILDEERAAPTVSYALDAREVASKLSGEYAAVVGGLAIITEDRNLAHIRSQQPRPVQENPRWWTLKSVNYNLLCALHAQVAADSKPEFVKSVLLCRMASPACGWAPRTAYRPRWNGFVSELPLAAEFCVRNGATQTFLEVLRQIKPSPGQAVLLQHLEDMIALNFTVFSDAEYGHLTVCSRSLRELFIQQYSDSRAVRSSQMWAGKSVELAKLFYDLRLSADCILEQCRKSKYLYLKGSLLEGLNVEINQDKEAVNSYLKTLGFTPTLASSLDEVERLYRVGGSVFELKASMGHLRSFLEGLHKEILPAALARFGGACARTWGEGLLYLRTNGVLSRAEEAFAASLYTLISDAGVHPLVAEREYARLFRNVVIEYALLLLSKLEKLGLKR